MKLLVCGGRTFRDQAYLDATLDALHAQTPVTLLIEGGALGADTLAHAWARKRGVACKTVPAYWGEHGRAAGAMRNERMLALGPDLVIAFPGGSGTAHMVRIARAAGVEVREVAPSEPSNT